MKENIKLCEWSKNYEDDGIESAADSKEVDVDSSIRFESLSAKSIKEATKLLVEKYKVTNLVKEGKGYVFTGENVVIHWSKSSTGSTIKIITW